MAGIELSAQVDRVEALESELSALRLHVGVLLRLTREGADLSLRDVAPRVRLTASAISMIENGKRWRTRTVRRVVRFYESLSAA